MRYVLMTAKKAGKCTICAGEIVPGDKIRWARGSGACHVNCETARLRHTLCTVCKGSGRLWNNAPCRQCDGTGSREMEERAPRPTISSAARSWLRSRTRWASTRTMRMTVPGGAACSLARLPCPQGRSTRLAGEYDPRA